LRRGRKPRLAAGLMALSQPPPPPAGAPDRAAPGGPGAVAV